MGKQPGGNPYDKYLRQYLTFEALEAGTFSLYLYKGCSDMAVSYSVNDGIWVDTTHIYNSSTNTITTPSLNVGDKVIWKCVSSDGSFGNAYQKTALFSSTGTCNIYGNILSLIYGDNFIGKDSIADGFQTFRQIFQTGLKCVSSENLIIPISVIKQYVCTSMFQNNTVVQKGPVFISEDIQANALYTCFDGCTSLSSMTILADSVNSSQSNWVRNVPSGGVLNKKKGTTWNLLPTGWTINYI